MASRALGQDLRVGLELGHYRIVEKIGAGGMGEVYRARDEHLARDVAIKVLPPGTLTDESARKHFRKEALILSQLNHPNVAIIYDFDTQQGVDFLVMEYIPGITLSDKVAAGPLPEKEVLRLGVQLAEGLAAAHDRGVIHRDLKPGNLRQSSEGRLKILDFGLARLRLPATPTAPTESLSETHTIAGTLPYMAPEQLLGGEIDARTDLHAAGLVLYEMATGRYPFAEVERSQLIGAILHRPPRPPAAVNSRLSPELERIIGKCLEKEPENRYQSAQELAIDLRRLLTPSAVASVRAAEAKPWRRRVRAATTGLATLFAVAALLVAFKAGGWRDRLLGRGGQPQIDSLAVLPLANLSRDPEQDYFSDGMTEALITDLARTADLRVISRTSVMHYKGIEKPLPEIARELHVDAVVEGSVQRSGNRVRITAQLIRAATDQHLWADSYERDFQDVLALQDEVAHAITRQVEGRLRQGNEVRRESSRPVNPEAYEAYLKGLYYWNKRTVESLKKSAQYFEEAIERDPSYAPAYAGLASFYYISSLSGILTPNESMPKAKAAAMKALQIDDSLAEAHAVLAAAIFSYDHDSRAAEAEYKRALELNPGSAQVHYWYGFWFLTISGRYPEAISEMQRAQALDPLSLLINTHLANTLAWAGHYDQAEQQYLKTLELDPHFAWAHELLAWLYQQKGMYEAALTETQKAAADSNDTPQIMSQLARAYALAGKRAEALKVVAELNRLSQQGVYVSSYDMATVYVALGDNQRSFAELERAFEEHAGVNALKEDPRFEALHSDPRFQDLLRRINIPQ